MTARGQVPQKSLFRGWGAGKDLASTSGRQAGGAACDWLHGAQNASQPRPFLRFEIRQPQLTHCLSNSDWENS
ncbi:predicted protein [Histoplasma capsulatum var. duboisii H88]|uniref:Predicted protein n=1 Tax=Ajellomyces capsulatus (strain H88) TaxID=544711 RepID=F0UUQ2_AJEC8|nr:predicted protein [Histoplasma capsulatum var. duboisii H88]